MKVDAPLPDLWLCLSGMLWFLVFRSGGPRWWASLWWDSGVSSAFVSGWWPADGFGCYWRSWSFVLKVLGSEGMMSAFCLLLFSFSCFPWVLVFLSFVLDFSYSGVSWFRC